MKIENNQTSNEELRFKTNINCSGCVAQVAPALNALAGLDQWTIDINSKDKVLSIQSQNISKAQIIETVQNAGFKIEPL